MTLGDLIDKIRQLFGGEPAKSRKLRVRVNAIKDKIKKMEDGLREVRRTVSNLEGQIDDLKRDLKLEKSPHNQELIMDDIERLEKEFGRKHDLARLKGTNVDAACVLRSKLEQMLEMVLNGGNAVELEDVLDQAEALGDDLADVVKLVKKLDQSPVKKPTGKQTTKGETDATNLAARRARILGETATAPAATPSAVATPEPARATEPSEPAKAPASDAGTPVAG